MRASATSRTSSLPSLQALQGKSNANPADATSPFALLLESTSPVQAAKPARKDGPSSTNSQASDRSPSHPSPTEVPDSGNGPANGTHPDRRAAPAKPAPAVKANKSHDQDAAMPSDNTVDSNQYAAPDQELLDLQSAAPMAPALASAAATQKNGKGDPSEPNALDDVAGAPVSGSQSDAVAPDSAAFQPSNVMAAQAAGAQQADHDQTDDFSLQTAAAAQAQDAPLGAKPFSSSENKTQTGKTAQNAPVATGAKHDAEKGGTSQYPDTGLAPTAAKDDANKGGARIRGAQTTITKDKPDSGNSDRMDDTRTGSVQATLDITQAPAPKSAPLLIQTANANFDISGTALPQPSPVSAAAGTPHAFQASAQPASNLPALAAEIVAKSQSGAKQFDIRLDPPELGRVDVRLSIDSTGKASAHLTADQPQTLTLLQNDAPALTRALREAGLDVSQDGLNFSLRQQAENFNGKSGEDGRRGSARNFSLAATNEIDATTVTAAYRAAANGRLDIRV